DCRRRLTRNYVAPVTSGSRARPGRRTRRRSPGAAAAEAAGPGSAVALEAAVGAGRELPLVGPAEVPVLAAAAADLGPARPAAGGPEEPAEAAAAGRVAAANPAVLEDGWCHRPAPAPVRG